MKTVLATKRHGYTLIELLTVIGLVALIITLIVPTIKKLRESAGLNFVIIPMPISQNEYGELQNYLNTHAVIDNGVVASEIKTLKAYVVQGRIKNRMAVGSTQTATFTITHNLTDKELEIFKKTSAIVKRLELNPEVKVSLASSDADGLVIQSSQTDTQKILGRKETTWTWHVTAKKKGDYKLYFTVNNIVYYKTEVGMKESQSPEAVYSEEVYVTVSTWDWIEDKWDKFWVWVMSVGALAITTAVVLKVKDYMSKDKKTDKETVEKQDETGDV